MSTASGCGSSGEEDDLVVTPGGPRPAEDVHQVRPGEAVRGNPGGTYTVVPIDASGSPRESVTPDPCPRESAPSTREESTDG